MILLQVKRAELNSTTKKVVSRGTERFGKVLWELTLDNIDAKIETLKKSKDSIHSKLIEGLSQIIPTLDTFLDNASLDEVNDDNFYIKVYNTVHLESGEILRATGDFQGKEWFSNVSVTPAEDQVQYNSDEGAWYGKVSENYQVFFLFFCFASLTDYLFERYCCCLNYFGHRQ